MSRSIIMLKIIIIYVFFSAALTFARPDRVVFGYYPDWVLGGEHAMTPQNIDYAKLTHVAVAFAYPDSVGSLRAHVAQYYTVVPQVVDSSRAHGVKVLVSLGGATLSQGFAPTCRDTNLLNAFVAQLVAHVDTYRLDGVDFDWEFPANDTEKGYYTAIIQKTRARLPDSLLVTLATPFWNDWSGKYIDYLALEPYLDYFNLMTYNYSDPGASAISGHNAPLYAVTGQHSINRSVQRFLSLGLPASKLTVGIPFYGKSYGSCAGIGLPFSGAGSLGASPGYYDVAPLVGNSYVRHWDTLAYAPYLTGNSEVICYDDSAAARAKAQYARDQGLAGVMIWQLQKAFISDGTVKGQQPLLNGTYAVFGGTAIADRQSAGQPVKADVVGVAGNPGAQGLRLDFTSTAPPVLAIDVFRGNGAWIENLYAGPPCRVRSVNWSCGERRGNGLYVVRVRFAVETVYLKIMVLE
jgi:chitinase